MTLLDNLWYRYPSWRCFHSFFIHPRWGIIVLMPLRHYCLEIITFQLFYFIVVSKEKYLYLFLPGAPVNHQSCRYLSLGYEKDKIRVQTAFCCYFYFVRNFYNLFGWGRTYFEVIELNMMLALVRMFQYHSGNLQQLTLYKQCKVMPHIAQCCKNIVIPVQKICLPRGKSLAHLKFGRVWRFLLR